MPLAIEYHVKYADMMILSEDVLVHSSTAFYWRHKILNALQNMANDVTLNGIVEADETFFAVSYKEITRKVKLL